MGGEGKEESRMNLSLGLEQLGAGKYERERERKLGDEKVWI